MTFIITSMVSDVDISFGFGTGDSVAVNCFWITSGNSARSRGMKIDEIIFESDFVL